MKAERGRAIVEIHFTEESGIREAHKSKREIPNSKPSMSSYGDPSSIGKKESGNEDGTAE